MAKHNEIRINNVNRIVISNVSQIQNFTEALMVGMSTIKEPEFHDIFQGNSSDTEYRNGRKYIPVRAMYLGTYTDQFNGEHHYWLTKDAEDRLMVEETYGTSDISTCAFHVKEGVHFVTMGIMSESLINRCEEALAA